jgi:hypothetical protein
MSVQGLVGLILRYDILWYIPPHARNFSRVPVSVRACGPASVSPCFVLQKKQKPLGTSRENALGLPGEEKNRCMGGAGTERGGSSNHAGI